MSFMGVPWTPTGAGATCRPGGSETGFPVHGQCSGPAPEAGRPEGHRWEVTKHQAPTSPALSVRTPAGLHFGRPKRHGKEKRQLCSLS